MAHILKVNDNKYINIDKITHVELSNDNTALHIWFSDAKKNIGELVLRGDDGATVLEHLEDIKYSPDIHRVYYDNGKRVKEK